MVKHLARWMAVALMAALVPFAGKTSADVRVGENQVVFRGNPALTRSYDSVRPTRHGHGQVRHSNLSGGEPGAAGGAKGPSASNSSLVASPLTPIYSVTGQVSDSVDAVGTVDPTGTVSVQKPASATVRAAFLLAASQGLDDEPIPDGGITLDGTPISWATTIPSSISSYNSWADVTNVVQEKIDNAAPGLVDFNVGESDSNNVDGEILAVVFNNPNAPATNSVSLLFGAQNVNGDTFNLDFPNPVDLSDQSFQPTLSLGISYGFQANLGSGDQYDIVDVNGQRLTTSAGGEDDYQGSDDGNGALITVGGIGDHTDNPPDPYATPTSPRSDDELYSLRPFLHQGDTSAAIYTENPSQDDNIFFAAFATNPPPSVTAFKGPATAEACSMSEFQNSDVAGDPTNCATGAFSESFGDLQLAGRGLPLAFAHAYDSLNANQDSPLGFGWTDSYNMFLSQDESGNIFVHEEGGTVVPFTSMRGPGVPLNEEYVPPTRVLATLVDNGDGTLTFTRDQEQVGYVFSTPTGSTAGQLLREVDLNGYTTSLSYTNGQLTSVTDDAGRTLTFAYDAANRIKTLTDAAGSRSMSFTYDDSGNLTDVIGVNGGHAFFTYYPGTHLLETMEDPRQYALHGPLTSGPVTSNVYDGENRVTSQTDPMGRQTQWSYALNNDGTQTTTVTDPKNNITKEVYENNTLISETDGYGTPQAATWQYQYDPATLAVTEVIDPNGNTWDLTYDRQGNLLASTQPLVSGESSRRTTTYTYNDLNEPLMITDPLNLTTTYSYGPHGNLTSVYRPAPSASQPRLAVHAREVRAHSSSPAIHANRPGSPSHKGRRSGSAGRYHSHAIPAAPKPTKTPTPRPATSTPTRTPVPPTNTPVPPTSTPTSTSTPTDTPVPTDTPTLTATATSTPLPSPTAEPTYGPSPDCPVTTPVGVTPNTQQTILSYADSSRPGDVTSVQDPDGNVTTIRYDSTTGNVTAVCDPMGNETTYGYDPAGRVISMVSPKGNAAGGTPSDYTTLYGYNAFDEQTSVTDPLQHQTTATYDENGNLSTLTDARQNPPTVYSYNADNELTGIARSDGTALGYSYDSNGNLAAEADGLQQTTSYQYDPLNRVDLVTDPLQRQTLYSYDGNGNLLTVLDPMQRTTTYTYDQVNELSSVSYSDGTTPSVHYTYDPDGEPATMTDGTGTSSYQFDILNRLSQSTDGAGNSVGYGYDLADNLTSITYPGSVGTVTRSYDPDNRLKTVSDWLNNTTTFGYDPNSNLTSEVYPNGITASYRYNTADQLTWIDDSRNGSPFWSYGYTRDPMGQVQTASDPVANTSHTYGYNQLNQLTSDQQPSGATSFGYDAADQLTGTTTTASDSGTVIATGTEYDPAGELTGWGKTQQNTLSGPIKLLANLALSYNADGDRTGSSDSVSGTSQTYGYDQADELTSYSSTGPGATSATYRYNGDGLRTSKTVNGSTSNQVWDLAEGLPVIIGDGATDYITGPGGLPVEQVAGDGSVLYYLQDQLGSTRGLTDASGSIATFSYDAYGNLTSSTGTATTPFGYAGQYTDSESGLQYLRARYYDPQTAQFLSVDPVVGVTQRPYAYAADDPLNSTDSDGLCATSVGDPPVAGLPPCIGPVFTGEHGLARVTFTRSMKYGNVPRGKFAWYFEFSPATRRLFNSLNARAVSVWIDKASVNGRAIGSPYPPTIRHIQTPYYNFHGSLGKYSYIGRKGSDTLRPGDILFLRWAWRAPIEVGGKTGWVTGYTEARCVVN